MLTVSEVMTRHPAVLKERDELRLADDIFFLGRLRHLPVTRRGKLVGLVTQRDLLRALEGTHRGRRKLAGQVMTTHVATVRPSTPLRQALRLMLKRKLGCLPVTTETGKLVGIITETDVTLVASQLLSDRDASTVAKSSIDLL